MVLQGEETDIKPTIHLMESGQFKKVLQTTTHGYYGYLYSVTHCEEYKMPYDSCSKLQQLLFSFSSICKEPMRSHNHHINLKEESQPINLRPYRYPCVQKSKIEEIVVELLHFGAIQPSSSPFAFPILLVKKQ